MSFWGNLFHREKCTESVVLIDIAADSVAGAYAHYVECETPALLYTRRLPIEIRQGEPHEQAMMRAFQVLGNDLIREGAPILMRATGSGNAKIIIVSVDTPWQETSVRTEHFERKEPFIFTKSMVFTAVEKTRTIPSEKVLADESIIGTSLNGYETRNPYGKKIHRASVVILTSLIDKTVSHNIVSTLRGLFHTKQILSIAGSSLRYQMMREVFPHEREALILDATGPLTSISLVRKGIFVALAEVPHKPSHHQWIDTVIEELTNIAEHYPLPRTIFLLARESEIPALQKVLEEGNLGKLWLSDNPPKIIPVLASHIVGLVRQTADAPPDLQLLLMTLFHQHHAFEGKE